MSSDREPVVGVYCLWRGAAIATVAALTAASGLVVAATPWRR